MYKSSNVPATTNATGQCLGGHISSTATAQSILNIETLRDTDTFGDIVKVYMFMEDKFLEMMLS